MINWDSSPFIRYVVFLVAGILLSGSAPPEILKLWPYIVILLAGSYLWFQYLRNRYYQPVLRLFHGLLGLTFIFLLGVLLPTLKSDKGGSVHFSHFKSISHFSAMVIGDTYDRDNYNRYLVENDQVIVADDHFRSAGKAHLYVKKDSSSQKFLEYGDRVYVQGYLNPIPPPKNPFGFDYQKYLRAKQVYGQAFVSPHQVVITCNDAPKVFHQWALLIRSQARLALQQYIHSNRESQIAQALIIGVKDYLDPTTKHAYATAGAMHVLAVSGLHVGIVYLLVGMMFGGLKRNRNGHLPFVILSIAVLWFYAMVTGMSPSVQRSTVMFTIIILSELSPGKSNIYNTLGIAAFILLCFDPFLIYSVGFQLSFLAVFGIVFFYPRIYPLIDTSRWMITDRLWQITSVSLAAQLSTFPLGIYYFHQFPTYFLITNIFVIPAASVILVMGFLTILFSYILPIVASVLGAALTGLLFVMNEIIFWIETLPLSRIPRLYFDNLEVWLIYLMIGFVVLGITQRSFVAIATSCLLALTVMGRSWINSFHMMQEEKMIVYHVPNGFAIDFIEGGNADLFSTRQLSKDQITYNIEPLRLAYGLPEADPVQSMMYQDLPEFLFLKVWKGHRILILRDSPKDYQALDQVACDVLIITNNVIESLEEIKWIDSKVVIFNSDNSYYVSKRLVDQAKERKLNYHSIADEGYWSLDLNKPTVL